MNDITNHHKEKLTIDLVKANIVGGLILIPIGFLFVLPYYLLWANNKTDLKNLIQNAKFDNFTFGILSVFFALILGIVVHELIHGFVWSIYAKNGFKSIKFGILWKVLTPYCHCKEPLKVRHYILGAIAPGLILGIVPALLAIFTGNLYLLLFGIFFTTAATGDFLIVNLIRKENMNDYVQDHPSEAGCYIYRKNERN